MDLEESSSPVQSYQLDGLLDNDTSDLPSSLIITNIHSSVFNNPDKREEFEELFKKYDAEAQISYFKSFRRARVNLQQSSDAARVRVDCHGIEICGSVINCYFAQLATPDRDSESPNRHLHPPKPEKMFLISPPASPPVGWEPTPESEPIINHELLSALANLQPGETHELHAATEEQPGIFVHTCGQDGGDDGDAAGSKKKIEHTKCPERPS